DAVVLMTLHSAKGLEFPIVFIAGMDDGLFPLERAKEKDEELEEERRLFYVGLTRAMTKIYLTTVKERLRYGMSTPSTPSPFLNELPAELVETNRSRPKNNTPYYFSDTRNGSGKSKQNGSDAPPIFLKAKKTDSRKSSPKVGQRIIHQTYGKGTVRGIIITDQKLLKIQFDTGITKTIAEKFVKAI
ncbi:MAG TPA: ATP-dependent DNA helicase PcrA, partial [Candidatus Marinimicrobia bacterium]|nr:ATP-dependent DNA helicase PcrA [Candidatus Neomarinimicrobiota bacterium]